MGLFDRMAAKLGPKGGISVDDALLLMTKGGVFVDVRTPREYEARHIPGAKLVDAKELAADPWTAVHGGNPLAEPDGVFVLVCDNGLRSSMLVDAVRSHDVQAEFLQGGMAAWVADGQVLISGPPKR